jgi:hypothetical protein
VSSGLRGPYPRAGSLRSFAPASAGTCPIGVDGARVSRANGRNRLRLIRVQPAASDPHGFEGRPGPRAMRRHPGRRPDRSLPRLGRSRPPARVGEGGFGPRRAERDEPPRACVMLCGKEGRPRARKARASLTGGARVNAPSHILPTTTGPSPAPHKSGQVPDTETAPMPPAKFSRAGFWRGMEGAGKGRSVEIARHADLPRKGENKKQHLVRQQKTPKASPPPGSRCLAMRPAQSSTVTSAFRGRRRPSGRRPGPSRRRGPRSGGRARG